jgi:hypothetical protein
MSITGIRAEGFDMIAVVVVLMEICRDGRSAVVVRVEYDRISFLPASAVILAAHHLLWDMTYSAGIGQMTSSTPWRR